MAFNETCKKFGCPDTLIHDYEHWLVLLRPQQVTLGSLVLATKNNETSLSEIPKPAFCELATVISEIERALKSLFSYDKINYLLLMMVDKHVHYHVIPRYKSNVCFCDKAYIDYTWPAPPDLSRFNEMGRQEFVQLTEYLRQAWPPGGSV